MAERDSFFVFRRELGISERRSELCGIRLLPSMRECEQANMEMISPTILRQVSLGRDIGFEGKYYG